MTFENKNRAVKFKRIFYLGSVFIAVAALILFLMDYTLPALICIGVFSIWFLYFHVADYHFIEFSTDDNKIMLRYYKAVKLGRADFSSIEFPQQNLHNAIFENSVFGKLSDITLEVKTKRGVAEYPSVSLSAVSFNDRLQIKRELVEIMSK